MQKISYRKITILGLVLAAASAVTAAVLPANSNQTDDHFAVGSITKNSGPGGGVISSATCEADTTPGAVGNACNYSLENCINSETSEMGGFCNSNSVSSDNNDGGLGENNTSDGPERLW